MKTTSTKRWSFFVLGVALVGPLSQAASEFRSTISTTEIRPGHHARLEITLVPDTSLAAAGEPVVFDDLLTQSKQFQLVDRDTKHNATSWKWVYDLTAYRSGEVTLPPISVTLGSEAFSTESTKIKVAGLRAADDEALRPDFDSERFPIPWRKWFERLLIAGGIFFTARQSWLWWKRRPRKRRVLPPVDIGPQESPEDWLRRELTALRARFTTIDDATWAIDDLSRILRGYFARKTAEPVESYTTRQFKQAFAENSKAVEISEVLEHCDVFRFASPLKEGARALGEKFVDKTERVLLA